MDAWPESHNQINNTTTSSESEYVVGEVVVENAKQEGYVIAILYIVMGIIAILHMILKPKSGKAKPQLLFLCQVLLLSCVRAIYSFAPSRWWFNLLHSGRGGVPFTVMIDMLPEVIFLCTYLLLTVTWGITRTTALKARHFSMLRFVITYLCIIATLLILTACMTLAIWHTELHYREALLCESIFTGAICVIAGIASLIIGLQLVRMLKTAMVTSAYFSHVQKQMTFIICISVTNLLVKGGFLFTIPTMQEQYKVYGKWKQVSFSTFWECYCILTEIVPFFLVLVVLYRKDPSEVAASKTSETETELLKGKQTKTSIQSTTYYAKSQR